MARFINNERPRYYPETHEYYFHDRWFDMDDPEQVDALQAEIERQEEDEGLYADWAFHARRDEGGC